jgi:RimJ/RimL family protein N-acetyltransferase
MIKPLVTKRLILRDFLPIDWEVVSAFLSDLDVTRYMHFGKYSSSELKNWFEWCLENNQLERPIAYNRAIVLKTSERLIGWFGIGKPSKPSMPGERDFGFALDKQFWGNGYMTEALQAVLAYEFEHLEAKRIFATCETENTASARVMEKAGMQYEGTFYDADFEGNKANRHRYGISYDGFVALKSRGFAQDLS